MGYLRPGNLSGGVSLDPELSLKAIESAIAGPLGFDVATAAYAVHNVANASMAAAIRVVTVQRGIDPRDFTLVAFGGAGPLRAVSWPTPSASARWSSRGRRAWPRPSASSRPIRRRNGYSPG